MAIDPTFKAHIEAIVSPLSLQEWTRVQQAFRPIKRRKHQFLVQEGDPVRYDYWVLKGCLKAYYLDESGKEHILQFATEGWWITDFDAYFNQGVAQINIDCLEDCRLLAVTLEERNALCQDLHKLEHFWRIKSNFGYIALQKRILSLLRYSAKERYEQLAACYPDWLQRIPKRLLASYLGVSRETLSRL